MDMETDERLQVDPRYVRDGYVEEINAFIENYRRECSERNIEYSLITTDQPYDRMLLDYLARRKAMYG
jgi:hypothetical protein